MLFSTVNLFVFLIITINFVLLFQEDNKFHTHKVRAVANIAKIRKKRRNMTTLSVNINKIATLRNARGENRPCLLDVALDCERFGADGITVHPRPDERHVKRTDVFALKPALHTEFNIEGYPSADFMEMVLLVRPAQVTLVPDVPDALTSSAADEVQPGRPP